MNLLIEQRSTILTSSKSQQQSQISNENEMNNSSSPSSPLVLKIKRHTAKHQQPHDFNSPSSHMSEEDNNSHSITTNIQRLKRTSLSNNTTPTRRPSSPAFNGKQQQATKRSVTIDNNNNDLTPNIDDISSTKRFKRDDLNSSSSAKVDACVETVSVGLATEPDHLGPCVLVVNVTWRGKTYVGTLLDSTKQDWACPRLTCESPTSDYDPRSSSKTNRSKRNSAGGTSRCVTQQSVSVSQQITSNSITIGVDDRKLRNNIKSRQSKRLNNIAATITEEVTSNSSPLTSPYRANNQTSFPSETTTTTTTTTANLEPQLISCTELQCHKRFTSTIALNYHLSDAHKKPETTLIIPQANTRDEEDVAHILANVADYVRRTSPPSSMRSSPEHQRQAIPSPTIVNSPPSNIKTLENCSPSTLTWPCPQISSKFVLPSPLNNAERVLSPNSTRCKLNNNDSNLLENKHLTDPDELKPSIKPADHFLLHIQDEPVNNKNSVSSPPPTTTLDLNLKKNRDNHKKDQKIPTPPPPPSLPQPSSPAYSDISDEEPTPSEQTLPPSTINLLTATNGKLEENGTSSHSSSSSSFLNSSDLTNPVWATQMLFQQFGPLIQQQALATAAVSNNKDISTTPNRLNSNNSCPSSNGTSDSTVKNILDARRSSTTKISSSSSSASSPPLPPASLYHFPSSNESKFPTPIINTLTSPNENLLHLSASSAASTLSTTTTMTTTIKPMDILDYSINNTRPTNGGQYNHSSSLHPSR
ncbi:unnamed protein product [Adineta ricciae]|uniref:C2H2-type domain-containing protein n=1 Tax=Adineta ricciae TaxID=249248 RepID=A0A813TWR0_ADIRI|nr:unnamed protein product [Adineta ricciae]